MKASDILAAWEAAESQHPIDRALTLLQYAAPGTTRAALAVLSIGERDRRLLALRERLYGPTVEACATCPACREALEFQFRLHDICVETTSDSLAANREFPCDDWLLDFRLPDSRDLAAIVGAGDRAAATDLLAQRCLLGGRRNGESRSAHDLPAAVVATWRERLGELDPQASVQLALACPACAHHWSELFDIAAFLWTEIAAYAHRLLREVDALARAYGWSEGDILQLSTGRRRAYLEMAGR